ncbi:MAG: DNA repair protein RadA [Elusimicrobiota bacterium]|jgi:DNA repair protein RadA/Sms|nr:DNA repair protein RadA [Elusimicrobiota bacterium]
MAPKEKIIFTCIECGYNSSKWIGKCPDCGSWNSFEETRYKKTMSKNINYVANNVPISLDKVNEENLDRFVTGINEFDRILGGGVVIGSLVLLGGAPGIGKSTLVLQASHICQKRVLYISGEESVSQIKIRANRIGVNSDNIHILSTDSLLDIENAINSLSFELVIVDSIQTVYNPEILNSAGSVSQIKDVASSLMRLCKTKNIAIFLIGHITKDGNLAGPKILEHIVDVVLYFEDDKGIYRIIRSFKNRFGNTSEIAVFEMTTNGLLEVKDPDKIFYDNENSLSSGNVISTIIEGTRALNIEVQALITKTFNSFGRRQITGFDINRIFFLIAVLEKKLKLMFYNQDVFINIVGGMKIKDIALDLAVCAGIISSYFDIILPKNIVFIGEVGLNGEIRAVSFMQERLKRMEIFGVKQLITANFINLKQDIKSHNKSDFVNDIKNLEKSKNIKIVSLNNIQDLLIFIKKYQ